MKTTRRDFIKISSMGVGGLALSASPVLGWVPGFLKIDDVIPDDSKVKRTPTYCEICFWKCAGWTYTDEKGKILKIVGNDDDQHSNGRFCPRGTGGVGMYNDEDRLKTPLIREEKDGKQYFREASWDEALDLISKRLTEIGEEYTRECIALFTHGSGGKFLGNVLKAFGSGSISAPSYAQCKGPREVAFIATYGKGLSSPEPTDIRNTRCLVLIGSHIGENMHNGQVQEMSEAIDNGATIITVDPRYSTAASKSKYWLPIKPATDIALLLAWMNVIIKEELYDKEYIEKYTFGFEQLKNHVKNKTPEWAYGITTIKPDVIRKTAREMAGAAPAAIVHPGRHTTWYGDDTQRLRAVAVLNALLGSWGRKGGFYMSEKLHLKNMNTPEYPKMKHTWRDAHPGKYMLADLALASGICDATIPSVDRECSYKAWIVNGSNLLTTIPNRKNTIEAINNLEFMVVIDTMPAEITGYADVVLPECTYLERYDMLRTSKHRKPSVALRMPAVEPKYNSKPDWWIAKQLAEKLGLGDYVPYNDITELLDWQLKQIGSSLEEMQKIGVKNIDREYNDLYILQGEEHEFNTNTGKIELYATSFQQEGFDPLPNYTAHPEPLPGFYRLNYGRAPMHTFGRTTNNPNLTDLMDENKLWVNPKVAKEWDLSNNQEVWLENQDGVVSTFPIKVRITERIGKHSVYLVHGFGRFDKRLKRSYGKGLDDSELITNVMVDPIMGGTGMRGNFVTFITEDPKLKLVGNKARKRNKSGNSAKINNKQA
ncbi:MAG: molybdopterin-dependent oxidoreductase [Bacteroidales bacterium]|nr:molybdopterin-dependent oxidoreductase [Bacteroidales bacterium]